MERRSRRAAANVSFSNEDTEVLPSRRSSRRGNTNYQDLHIDDSKDDQDFEGDEDEEDDDDGEEDYTENRKNGSKGGKHDDVDEDDDLGSDASDSAESDGNSDGDELIGSSRGRGRPPLKKRKQQSVKLEESDAEVDSTVEQQQVTPKKRPAEDRRDKKSKDKRRRGVPLVDENGDPFRVKDFEVITPDDPKGDTKIDMNGSLLGGRRFKCRTFTCLGKGDKLFMLSTEPARCVGFRDSYLLFQKHPRLYKLVLTEEEKADLIERELLAASHRSRTISLVAARSIYKQFGSKIVLNGKQVLDDYYEDKAREAGAIEGAPAYVNADDHYTQQYQMQMAQSRNALNQVTPEVSWMYDNAFSVKQYDARLLYDRLDVLSVKGKFQKDPYTGVTTVPDITQSKRVKIMKFNNSPAEFITTKKKLVYDTVIYEPNCVVKTGLADVPLEIFDGVVSNEVKQAILAQQALEKEF